MEKSPFGEAWRDSLREQFKRVARTGSPQRLEDMIALLTRQGFSQEEINALYIRATMRTDDLPEDFTPNADILALKRKEIAEHAAECTCPRCQAD